MFNRNSSAGTAAQKRSKSSWLAGHPLLLAILMLGAVSCQNTNQKVITPQWVKQNIDTVDACNIIFCDNVKLIKVGNSYTATYTFNDTGETWFKVDKKEHGVDFGFERWGIRYYPDSCNLKEDLRSFMKLQITKYISDHLQADRPK